MDNNGRKIYIQLKWFGGDRRANGDLIIKVIKIEPAGGNVLTNAVENLVQHPDVHKWKLNKVVMESIIDRALYNKMIKEEGGLKKSVCILIFIGTFLGI